jgi:hypothetical protein
MKYLLFSSVLLLSSCWDPQAASDMNEIEGEKHDIRNEWAQMKSKYQDLDTNLKTTGEYFFIEENLSNAYFPELRKFAKSYVDSIDSFQLIIDQN